MHNIKVIRLNASQEQPEAFISNIANITFSKKLNTTKNLKDTLLDFSKSNLNIIRNVFDMGHLGMLEHVTLTYLIQGASRSLLSQITRHRQFSFISASQHYMDYSNFADFVIPYELNNKKDIEYYLETNKQVLNNYQTMIKNGTKHEVARQLLPNSMRNNLIMTGNLRGWEHFLNLRLCNRNTSEIQYIAYLIKKDLKDYIPNIIGLMGPDCLKLGYCTQKQLCCGETYTDNKIEKKYEVLLNENKSN